MEVEKKTTTHNALPKYSQMKVGIAINRTAIFSCSTATIIQNGRYAVTMDVDNQLGFLQDSLSLSQLHFYSLQSTWLPTPHPLN